MSSVIESKEGAQAQKKVTAFEAKKQALVDFINENTEIFDVFFDMASEYNVAREAAKDAIKGIKSESGFSIGDFRRSTASTSESYNPALLPATVLAMPNVVKEVDSKEVDNLLKNGYVTPEQLTKARVKKTATPKIDGPQELKVKL